MRERREERGTERREREREREIEREKREREERAAEDFIWIRNEHGVAGAS